MKTGILLTILLVSFTCPLAAQASEWAGKRVRVIRIEGKELRGKLHRVSGDSVHLIQGTDDPRAIPRNQIDRIEGSLGRYRDFPKFFLLGAGASVVGGIMLQGIGDPEAGPSFAAASGVLLALPIGLLAGTFMWAEDWTPIHLPRASSFSLSASPERGLGVGITVQLGR